MENLITAFQCQQLAVMPSAGTEQNTAVSTASRIHRWKLEEEVTTLRQKRAPPSRLCGPGSGRSALLVVAGVKKRVKLDPSQLPRGLKI